MGSYQTLAKKIKNRFAGVKKLAIHELVFNKDTTGEENTLSALIQNQYVDLVPISPKAADKIYLQVKSITNTIMKYYVLRSMVGAGDHLRPIILGEIGDIRCFHSSKALNAKRAMMSRCISLGNSRAVIVTSQTVATRPS